MTAYQRDEAVAGRTGVWQLARQFVLEWLDARRVRRERRGALLYMAEMPDWQLRDIGLHRGDVHRLLEEENIALDRADPNQPH